ncbi:TPA: hypothetical protein ACP60H_004646 [Escherichia coli]
MAKNDFKAFATDRNANVMSQEEWEALPALISGFTAGKASSAQVNKVIRQASFIAAALAQFVSDKTQRDVLDNGDLPGFVELLGSGFAVEYLSRKNPFGDIKSDGTVKTALENLGLDTALAGKQAKDDTLTALSGKNVAQLLTYLTLGPIANAADIAAGSANKLIDAYGLNSYFPSRRFGTSGYIRIPNQPGGLILQWGTIPAIPAGGYVTVSYGFAFPEACLVVIPIAGSSSGAANSVLSAGAGDPRLSFQVFNSLPGVTDSTGTGAYIALGF